MPQVEENLRVAADADSNALDPAALALVALAQQTFAERTAIPCTRCGYCMPCPNGINIPFNFELYNDAVVYEDVKEAPFRYKRFMAEGERASACTACRACEGKCPQQSLVSEWMPKVAEALAK